jgi:hypothetical protein
MVDYFRGRILCEKKKNKLSVVVHVIVVLVRLRQEGGF